MNVKRALSFMYRDIISGLRWWIDTFRDTFSRENLVAFAKSRFFQVMAVHVLLNATIILLVNP